MLPLEVEALLRPLLVHLQNSTQKWWEWVLRYHLRHCFQDCGTSDVGRKRMKVLSSAEGSLLRCWSGLAAVMAAFWKGGLLREDGRKAGSLGRLQGLQEGFEVCLRSCGANAMGW